MCRAIVVAGTNSGSGKTTISIGLMGALLRHGLKVQPFKSGPDYIDPSYHTMVTGVSSRNLDTWMLGSESVLELYCRAAEGNDISVVEGVMGLYDGRYSTTDDGSTAELAKLLQAPVILIIDSRSGARSVAAVARGFRDFDPDLRFAGVILNGIGSTMHYDICREAIEYYTSLPVLGYLPRRDDIVLPERHLGLIPAAEDLVQQTVFERLVSQCTETFDIQRIVELAETAGKPEPIRRLFPETPIPTSVRIAVARDRAFSFYYQDNLDLLKAWGAELIDFSPIRDTRLPENSNGIYLGGGFPEMYAAELANNDSMKKDISNAVESGMPVLAECGGYMYLGKSINNFEDNRYPMAGIFPIESQIKSHKLSLGYRTVTACEDNILLKKGERTRAHEFHWSTLTAGDEKPNAWSVEEKGGFIEGFQRNNLLASYIHIHFGSNPNIAPNFVENCKKHGCCISV